jgi:hypothetical protein
MAARLLPEVEENEWVRYSVRLEVAIEDASCACQKCQAMEMMNKPSGTYVSGPRVPGQRVNVEHELLHLGSSKLALLHTFPVPRPP